MTLALESTSLPGNRSTRFARAKNSIRLNHTKGRDQEVWCEFWDSGLAAYNITKVYIYTQLY